MPLETDFHAVVDGTNGDTYLKQVDAKLQDTPITASGAIESQKGVKGRTIKLDVKIEDGRIQDVLRLAVKAPNPVMLGRIALEAKLLLPPRKAKVIDKLQLDGRFALEGTHFTDAAVQKQARDAQPARAGQERRRVVREDRIEHERPVRAARRHAAPPAGRLRRAGRDHPAEWGLWPEKRAGWISPARSR